MLITGHAGIALGAAVLLNGALTRSRLLSIRGNREKDPHQDSSELAQANRFSSPERVSWFTSLGRRVDIRILLLGSLLPDIIDKPVGQYFFRETFGNGRIFCHTLLFLIVISLPGIYLFWRHHRTWLLVLASGVFAHLVLDKMWLNHQTFLWPWYGFSFKKLDLTYWTRGIFEALLTDPAVYIPELIGAVILVWFALELIFRKKVYVFLIKGQVKALRRSPSRYC